MKADGQHGIQGIKKVLVTGGAGFFGGLLKRHCLDLGLEVVSLDLCEDEDHHPNLRSMRVDLVDPVALEPVFQSGGSFDAIFHCAAIMAHAVQDKNALWRCNVEGTRNIGLMAGKYDVPKIVFTSSNCLWGRGFGRPVTEEDEPAPIEIYGKSKVEGEKVLWEMRNGLDVVILRCPTIMDAGRLGLLTILFDFVREGRKVWVVGGGKNVYQFIYAPDLINACLKAAKYDGSEIFNIGSDHVKSFREVYEHVIREAGTKARIANFPRFLALPAMKLAYALKLSPLGPYQYKMIAEDFLFDTSKIKEKLGWKPTATNEEMLLKAYHYYAENFDEIHARKDVSSHRHPAKMGVIKLLKWIS